MGVVYCANYPRWFEMGRTELLRQTGLRYSSIEAKGLFFPVTEVSCRYFKPARFDDEIVIETTLTTLGRATLDFSYRISRKNDGLLLVEGWTRHACVDNKGEVTRILPAIRTRLKAALCPGPKVRLKGVRSYFDRCRT